MLLFDDLRRTLSDAEQEEVNKNGVYVLKKDPNFYKYHTKGSISFSGTRKEDYEAVENYQKEKNKRKK